MVVRNTFIDCELQEEKPRRLCRSSSAPPLLPPERAPRGSGAPESGGRCADSEGEAPICKPLLSLGADWFGYVDSEGKAQQDVGEADSAASEGDDEPGKGEADSAASDCDDVLGKAPICKPLLSLGADWFGYVDSEGKAQQDIGEADTAASEGDDVLRKVEGIEARMGKPSLSRGAEWRTTVLFRNVPFQLKRDAFVELLDSHGFRGKFDMVYVPMDFRTNQALGYSFVNAVDSETAVRLLRVFEGFRAWPVKSQKTCAVCWSNRQGLESNVRVYRNLAVIRQDAPESWKPALFSGGSQVPLPQPTRRIKSYWKQHWRQHGSVGTGAARP